MASTTSIPRESILVVAQQLGLAAGGPEDSGTVVFGGNAEGSSGAGSGESGGGSLRSTASLVRDQQRGGGSGAGAKSPTSGPVRPEDVPCLSERAAAALAPDVEYRVREVIQEALKFMRRSRREVLTADDVNQALRARRVPRLYGYSRSSGAADAAAALGAAAASSSSAAAAAAAAAGADEGGGASSSSPAGAAAAASRKRRHVATTVGGVVPEPAGLRFAKAGDGLFYLADREVAVADVLNAPLPPLPPPIAATMHWLAVEGVVPRVPENTGAGATDGAGGLEGAEAASGATAGASAANAAATAATSAANAAAAAAAAGDSAAAATAAESAVVAARTAAMAQRRVASAGADAMALLTTARSGGGQLAAVATPTALSSATSALAALLSAVTPSGEIEVPTPGGAGAPKKRRITAATAAALAANTDREFLTRERVRPTVEHALSRELQLYFETLMRALVNTQSPSVVTAALDSLSTDSGISQLMPYLAQFVVDEVAHAVHEASRHRAAARVATRQGGAAAAAAANGSDELQVGSVAAAFALTPLKRLQRALAVCRALLDNSNMFVEPYLHQLMPAVLTVAVGRHVDDVEEEEEQAAAAAATVKSERKVKKEEEEEGAEDGDDEPPAAVSPWALRDAAAGVIGVICQGYAGAYANLQPRIVSTLASALVMEPDGQTPMRPVCTLYGAVRTLGTLGSSTISSSLLPQVGKPEFAAWLARVAPSSDAANNERGGGRATSPEQRLRQACTAAVASWLEGYARAAASTEDAMAALRSGPEAASLPLAEAAVGGSAALEALMAQQQQQQQQ